MNGLWALRSALDGLLFLDPRAHALHYLLSEGATFAEMHRWLDEYCPNWWAAGRAAAGWI